MAILQEVKQLGQQIWLDNLSRSLVRSGTLAKLQQSGVSGVTSNPAIFRQALAGDALYTAEIAQLKQQPLSAKARYETLAVADVQAACDVFAAQFAAEGNSGLVSLECDPALSHDTEGTIAEARRLWNLIGRPNAMIKIPATDAGLAALPDLVADGININLTLLFSRAQTVRAYQAYQQGLAQCTGQVAPQLVASFFISRIDTALDPQLPPHLQGKTALALAQAAYRDSTPCPMPCCKPLSTTAALPMRFPAPLRPRSRFWTKSPPSASTSTPWPPSCSKTGSPSLSRPFPKCSPRWPIRRKTT